MACRKSEQGSKFSCHGLGVLLARPCGGVQPAGDAERHFAGDYRAHPASYGNDTLPEQGLRARR